MAYENGEWVLHGLAADDPYRLKTPWELLDYINEVGFLPLFAGEIPGLSVEERTLATDWWSENEAVDPWEWRRVLAASGKVAYGKFFGGKAGFISLSWFPAFCNWRRDGYDFDARYEDELATFREKKIMDQFQNGERLFSHELKRLAGFGKGGEKNFPGVVAGLQEKTYLVLCDFRQRLNKKQEPYGWALAVYATPETVFGADTIAAAYAEKPAVSKDRIFAWFKQEYPIATDKQIEKLFG